MRPAWTAQSLRPYVAEIDAQGRATDWLFDSFLFIEYETDSGRGLNYARARDAKDKPQPDLADWQWLADEWFRPDSGPDERDRPAPFPGGRIRGV